MKKIGIIGCGKIGSSIAYELIKHNSISELHIFNRSNKVQNGLLKTLKLVAHQLSSKVMITEIDFNDINSLDLIVVAIKESYDPRNLSNGEGYPIWLPNNLRYVGFPKDFTALMDVAKKIKDYQGLVATITNPVEIVTKILCDNIETDNVFGLGASIDALRISYLLDNKFKGQIQDDGIVLLGEHGNESFIVERASHIPDKLIDIQEIVNQANRIGFEIVNNMGYTLYDCISPFVKDIFWLLGLIQEPKVRSFACSNSGFILTHPITRESGSFKLFSDLTEFEKGRRLEINESLKLNHKKMLTGVKKKHLPTSVTIEQSSQKHKSSSN